MREIKFRIWRDGKMQQLHQLNAYDNHLFNAPDDREFIMQFTGLSDKNGKDIYEGDILGVDCHMADDYTGKETIEVQKLPVRWDEVRAMFTVYCPSAIVKTNWGHIPYQGYIIGNIYENPELIKTN